MTAEEPGFETGRLMRPIASGIRIPTLPILYSSPRNKVVAMSTRSGNGRQLLSVAPMMDWTDVHYRQLARIISKRTWLWTEMVRQGRSTESKDQGFMHAHEHGEAGEVS
jgi:hypothetical protein